VVREGGLWVFKYGRQKVKLIFVLVLKNPATWLYSLHEPMTLECDCPNDTRRNVELVGAGLLRHPATCCLRNELLILSVGRSSLRVPSGAKQENLVQISRKNPNQRPPASPEG
jgi:hypothetical protein